jgi:hypothetical protein
MTTTTKTKKTTTTTEKPIASLPTNPFVFEILELASKQRSNSKKVEVLKTYDHPSLKTIFIWNFDESIISLLPEGDVPYADANDQTVYSGTLSENLKRESQGGESATGQDLDGRGKTSLRKEYQNLYHFVKGGNNSLNNIRREMMFINLLRGLHPKEAEVLILTKDKLLANKYKITFENVKEAYPDIQWGGRS